MATEPPPPIFFHGRQIIGRMPPFKPFLRAANREGRKTMTRRVIDSSAKGDRYGQVGDVRVMCEPLKELHGYAIYADDSEPVVSLITGKPMLWRWSKPLLTSIHMPTEAGRFVVEYTALRTERLQEITPEDAIHEGVKKIRDACHVIPGFGYDISGLCHNSAIVPFQLLWEFINGARPGCAWEENPFVRVISYRQITKEMLRTRPDDIDPRALTKLMQKDLPVGEATRRLIQLGSIPAKGEKGRLCRIVDGQPVPITSLEELS